MPKAVKVKILATGVIAYVTPRAYELQEKLFDFIANVQVDEEGNEITPKAAPKAESPKLTVSQDESVTSPNAPSTGSASDVAPVVAGKGRPGRKPQTPQ
jgi:hypothetical protein